MIYEKPNPERKKEKKILKQINSFVVFFFSYSPRFGFQVNSCVHIEVVEQHFNSECSVDSTQMGRLAFTDQISYDYMLVHVML